MTYEVMNSVESPRKCQALYLLRSKNDFHRITNYVIGLEKPLWTPLQQQQQQQL